MGRTKKSILFGLVILLAGEVHSSTYYVSTTGSDLNDGSSPELAWASIEHGDTSSQIQPGDIINILPGTYYPASTVTLTLSGDTLNPIIYRTLGFGRAVLDGQNLLENVLAVEGDYTEICGLELTNATGDCMLANNRYGTVRQCYVHHNGGVGIVADDRDILMERNIVAFNSGSGIEIRGFCDDGLAHGNTVYGNGNVGIEIFSSVEGARVFNCIVAENNGGGIKGDAFLVIGFNNVYGNVPEDYIYVTDSAGGLEVEPQFVDPAKGRFDLKHTAAQIDAGLDLGYSFNGPAPDMGAIEKFNVYYVRPDGSDSADGRTGMTAWQTIDNANSFLLPGDTVYVLPGTYNDSVFVSDTGLADDMISYVGLTDDCFINISGPDNAVYIWGNYVSWTGINISGASGTNIHARGVALSITGNVLGPGGAGVLINGRDCLVKDNVFLNNSIWGLYAWQGEDNLYINNTFFQNGYRDYVDLFGVSATLSNNIFLSYEDNDTAIEGYSWDGITHCIFYGYTVPITTAGEPGEGCLIGVDPLLIDPLNGDFHPQQASPVIDAGFDFGFPFHGSAPDIGAFQTNRPTRIEIVDAYDTLVSGVSYPFQLNGFDSADYPTRPGPTVWSHNLASGIINSQGVFTPGQVGTGMIIAEAAAYALWDSSASLMVIAGELDELIVNPDRYTLKIDSSHTFSLQGSDAAGNTVTDLGVIFWDVLNGIGSIDQSGHFTAENVGYGFVRATSNLGVTGMTDTITVLAGDPEVLVTSLSIPPRELIPGFNSGPILAFELTNDHFISLAVDSVRLHFTGYDPGGATQAQLDSQIEAVNLYLEGDNQWVTLTSEDSLLNTASLSDGQVMLVTGGLSIPPNGGTIRLTVAADLSAEQARNGNFVGFELAAAADLYLGEPVPAIGDFPIGNGVDFSINAFTSAVTVVNPVEAFNLYQDQVNRLVLDLELPRDGYADDLLGSVMLINRGSYEDNGEVLNVTLWADATGDGFSSDDTKLGTLDYGSGYWQISGLSYPLTEVTTRFFATVDIIDSRFEGGTLDLEIPVGGIEYASGMDGPDDLPLSNPTAFIVIPADRVTAVSVPMASTLVQPGDARNIVLTFALYNGYSTARELVKIRLANQSRTASTPDFVDAELGQVSLHFDGDYDRVFDSDPAVASGYFSDGLLSLSPSDLMLPAESLCYFYVAVDLPDRDVIDSDSLTVSIVQESDLVFEPVDGQPVNINGDMPLLSGGYLIIDGSVAHQYDVIETVSSSLLAGDTSVVLFAFKPAANGDQTDRLVSLMIENAGSAGPGDIESLELWLDGNGDDSWQSYDSLVASLTYTGVGWSASPGDLNVETDPATLFVVGDISLMATPDATFRAEIPLDGCQYLSGNDGPTDMPVTAQAEYVLSNSPVRLSAVPLDQSYSVGQDIQVTATVTNLLGTTVDSVYCQFVAVNNSSDSIVVGPQYLASQESSDFIGIFTASQIGSESWRLRAFFKNPADSSAVINTDVVEIDQTPSPVTVELLNSIPTAVSRGQSNVFPLSVHYFQEDTSSARSSLRLDSLTISIEDGLGQPLPANSVFSRMVLATDNINLVVLSAIPSQSFVTLNFAEPVILPPGEEQLLSLLVDIDSLASASTLVLGLSDQGAIRLVDHNSLNPVAFDAGLQFPMLTAACRIENPSEQLAVSGVPTLSSSVNYGQENVSAIELVLRHPGETGTSQIQLTNLSVEIVDDQLVPVAASQLIAAVRVLKQQLIVGELLLTEDTATVVTIDFGAPPTLGPGETETLLLQLDMKSQPSHDAFGLRVHDSTSLTVRDLSSGSIVASISDPVLATGNVFPLSSGLAQLKYPATPPELCLSSALPAYVIGGATEVELMEMTVVYPATSEHSSLRADDIAVRLFDSEGVPLNPNDLFDQIGVSINDAAVTYDPYIELQNGHTVFHLGDEGLLIGPQDSVSIKLFADIESATAVQNFMLVVQNQCALTVCDATDTLSHLEGVMSSTCSATIPFQTAVSEVYLRAGRPDVAVDSRPAQLAFPGQQSLPLMELTLSYNSPVLQGDILLNRIVGETAHRTRSGMSAQTAASLFEKVAVTLDGDTVAVDSSLSGDSVVFAFSGGVTVSRGGVYHLRILGDLRPDAPLGNYLIQMKDSSFCEMQDKNLLTVIYPLAGASGYPLLSTELSLTQASLEESFTNYPNPFNPDIGQETTIGFVLTEDARIDIELFTITGKLVKRVATDNFRSAGAHQQDKWDGSNDRGLRVRPGTYFCRVTANYVSGRSEIYKRKISVVR
ncbi:MAG: right-handed parallel beta-helix repeat-containing protein [Candidatus Zixiibacteriota bacterium]|nr:MAG: right-handed parallel beta-helix repeat-containing protein [candidate division Zixibacteria bacterium]